MKAATSKLFLFVQLIAFVYSSKDRCPEMTPQNKIKNKEELKAMKGLWYMYAMIGNAPGFHCDEQCIIQKHSVEGLKQSIEMTVRTKLDTKIANENALFKHSPNDLNKFDFIFTEDVSYPFTLDAYDSSKYFSMYYCEEKVSYVSDIYIFMKRDNNTNLDSEEMLRLNTSIVSLELQDEDFRLLEMDCNQD